MALTRCAQDRLDLPVERIALGYRYGWTVELFFPWLKCILGRRHWLGESLNALTIQIYAGLIASLLLTVWSNQKLTNIPSKWYAITFPGGLLRKNCSVISISPSNRNQGHEIANSKEYAGHYWQVCEWGMKARHSSVRGAHTLHTLQKK
mgnify:CR=1 FL=1